MSLHQIIEQHWQHPKFWLTCLLKPLSIIFTHIITKRRTQFLSGSLNTQKLPIPVVIIGNIHAGGTGKTPITAALVQALQHKGINIGIISRGYGRKDKNIHILNPNSTAEQAGDEPLMLYRQTQAPIAVGSNRYEAGLALLAQHPQIQLILADDGLQHYALARDLEIAVFPAHDVGRQDLDLLPNGGLREPLSRLNDVDFIVISNSNPNTQQYATHYFRQPEKLFTSQIEAAAPYRLNQPQQTLSANDLTPHSHCIAIAAIAHPHRFFNTLAQQGFPLNHTLTLPDHAPINPNQIPNADYVFITEKDATKLTAPHANNIWVLPIKAHITPDLAQAILDKLTFQAA